MVICGEMLIGEYQTKLGERNRIALPVKFRKELGGELIVTRGYEKCLVLVTQDQFKDLTKALVAKEFTLSKLRDTSRFLVGGASEVECDEQGRFVLPKNLVDYAGMGKEVVFVGLINWVEVWDLESWNERLNYLKDNSADIADKLSEMKNVELP